jgi:hypothetical protein
MLDDLVMKGFKRIILWEAFNAITSRPELLQEIGFVIPGEFE